MRRAALLCLVLVLPAGCARARSPGFPPPARPPVLVQVEFEQAFANLRALLEARGMPLVVDDADFGFLRTDWIYWDPGELDLTGMAECPISDQAPPARTRARFGFDVRRRTVQTTVTILGQWQVERGAAFDGSDRGFVECRSTGEWERTVEETLTQRGTIR